jgi:toxin ParE1/3/4
MAKVVWTEESLRWLEDIFEFIAQDNPQAAAQTVDGIYERVQALVDFPALGQRYASSHTPCLHSALRPLSNRVFA